MLVEQKTDIFEMIIINYNCENAVTFFAVRFATSQYWMGLINY